MNLTAPYYNYDFIPLRYTCRDVNISPPLEWDPVPGALSYLVVMYDLDANNFIHWLLYNIPSNTTSLDENTDVGTLGYNSSLVQEYTGPCPPPNQIHQYITIVYAINSLIDLQGDPPTLDFIMGFINNRVLASSRILAYSD